MDGLATALIGGLLLGLAGSVHCACMCGGIASGALFILNPATPRERLRALLLLQGGRITVYALAGGAVASLLTMAIDPALTANSYRMLQWLGAFVLMWIGLATAGMLPRAAISALAGESGLAAHAGRLLAPLKRQRTLGPLALGFSWGLTPCPLVYAALFSAALMGSFANGMAWMLGFGAGTLPGVIGAALGITRLPRLAKSKTTETIAGLAIAFLGFSSVYFNWLPSALICTTP